MKHDTFFFKLYLEKKENKIFSGGCDQNTAIRIGIMLDHISRFFHSLHKTGLWSFPACRKWSCWLSLPSLPGSLQEQVLTLTHMALQTSLPPQKQRSTRVTCHAHGDPGGKPDLKAVPFSWIACTWMELPEHVPVTESWELSTAESCASYPYCLGGVWPVS